MSIDDKTAVRTDGMARTMRVVIRPEKCIGAGHCVAAADDVFGQNEDDGIVVLLIENPSAERQAAAQNGARACPVAAIEIEWE
jgi:ferredoxin